MAIAQEKYYEQNRGQDLRKLPAGDPFNGEAPTTTKRWKVSEMWNLHHEIARRLVLGQKNTEIAKALEITPQTVSNVKCSPIVQEQMALLGGTRDAEVIDLKREIEEIVPEAVFLLKDIIRGEGQGQNASLTLRAKESNNMLARVGHGVPQKIQSENIQIQLTSQDISDIKQRAAANSDVIDINKDE